jgi:hypothetical protein
LTFGRKQQRDVAAEDLTGGISEHALGRWIPHGDAAIAIVADNRVVS